MHSCCVGRGALLACTCCCQCLVVGKVSSPLLTDEREAVQKKTFTKWVNSHLARVSCRITDLYTDLRDGRMLIKLLEVLSGERLVSTIKWGNIFWTNKYGLVSWWILQWRMFSGGGQSEVDMLILGGVIETPSSEGAIMFYNNVASFLGCLCIL